MAAVSPEVAVDAARLVEVTYEEKPFVHELRAAMEDGAPQVFTADEAPLGKDQKLKGNIAGPNRGGRGNVASGFAQAAVEPRWVFFAPVHAVEKLLVKTGRSLDDFDLVEINEAFASQSIADGRKLGLDWERLNVNGGAIALGHPTGMSGARIVGTAVMEMQRRHASRSLATMCIGVGQGIALELRAP